jgi:Catalase
MPKRSRGFARRLTARTSGQSASALDKASLHGETDKTADLALDTVESGEVMSGNQGVKISDDQNSLKAGLRGSTLMEDSTVAGSRGSTDCARDVRGFAVKFYTDEGIWDLVGNMPVFFIQDAIKFPDLIHAVKPEPNNEIPQAASAHDTFWDFVSLTPESAHMLMWVMSDRALPRSFATMEGFGVHTFRLINAAGELHGAERAAARGLSPAARRSAARSRRDNRRAPGAGSGGLPRLAASTL